MTQAAESSPRTLPEAAQLSIFIGNYGSGKTEIAINYAVSLAAAGEPVTLVDLDVINPYFRSREARSFVEARGVTVVAPENEFAFADLPIILRDVAGSILSSKGKVVLDVGGDDLGARVLGSYASALRLAKAEVMQVVNPRRPFTDSPEGVKRMYEMLEAASQLRVSGLVANAHLIDETTFDIVTQGIAFTQKFSEVTDVPLRFAAVRRDLLAQHPASDFACPVLPLDRYMTSPWELSQRRGPIGRPPKPELPAGVR